MEPKDKQFPEGAENKEHAEGREKLRGMFDGAGIPVIQDPETHIMHVDLSDPEHPFWTGKYKDD